MILHYCRQINRAQIRDLRNQSLTFSSKDILYFFPQFVADTNKMQFITRSHKKVIAVRRFIDKYS